MYRFAAVILFLSLMRSVCVFSAENVTKPHMNISYAFGVDREEWAALIQTLYEELGFEVSIIRMPVKRGITQLSKGEVDSDVIRLSSTTAKYDNVILVKPALIHGYLVLLCNKKVPCNLEALKDKNLKIQTHEGLLNEFAPQKIKAKMIIKERTSSTLKMLEASRILYALETFDKQILDTLITRFNHVKIKEISGYHVIHKKHLGLLPKIENKLRQKLQEK